MGDELSDLENGLRIQTHVAGAPADRASAPIPVNCSRKDPTSGDMSSPSESTMGHMSMKKAMLMPARRAVTTLTDSEEESGPTDYESERESLIGSRRETFYGASYGGDPVGQPRRSRRLHRLESFGSNAPFSGFYRQQMGRTARPHFLELNVPETTAELPQSASVLRLAGLIDDDAGKFEHFRVDEKDLKQMRPPLQAFYREQNATLDMFAEIDEILDNVRADVSRMQDGTVIPAPPLKYQGDSQKVQKFDVQFCVNMNFAVNFLLLVAKVTAVLLSHSVSVTASAVDTFMDFVSTIIITGTSWVQNSQHWRTTYEYPVGRHRMEPISIVIFSVCMISSFVQVLIESAERLMSSHLELTTVPLVGIVVIIGTVVVKIALWFWMRGIRNASVQALRQDAENDIIFNLCSLLFPLLGSALSIKQLDALGGACLSIYIIVEWFGTLFENVFALSGRRADPREYQRVCYLLTRFSKIIIAIQHLHVYHTGGGVIIEVDVVVPTETALSLAHNVAESAQYALEELDGVQRAFVHVDVSVNPLSGHITR